MHTKFCYTELLLSKSNGEIFMQQQVIFVNSNFNKIRKLTSDIINTHNY